MNTATLNLENKIKAFAFALDFLKMEAKDIYKIYFATNASALVGGLALDGTAATVTSALTKGEFINGVTLVENLSNFFSNAAVSQGDYLATCFNLAHGSNAASSALSGDVENMGDRLKALAMNCIELRRQCDAISALYNGCELSAAIGSLSASNVIFGCNTTKTSMVNGIVLAEQFLKMLTNQAVTTGDYQATVTEWTNKS